MKFRNLIGVLDKEQYVILYVVYDSSDCATVSYKGLFCKILSDVDLNESEMFEFDITYMYVVDNKLFIRVEEYER